MQSLAFHLDPLPPFRLDLTAWALRRRPHNNIDRFQNGVYSRVMVVEEKPLEVSVSDQPGAARARVLVRVTGAGVTKNWRRPVGATVEKMFGTSIDLSAFYAMAHRDPHLGPLAGRFRGLKPPRFPTVFEAAVNGIACQQLSLDVGIALLNRMAEACSLCCEEEGGLRPAFPRPQDILKLRIPDFRAMGFSTRKAEFLLDLADAVAAGRLDLEAISGLGREKALESLMNIRGVGRWTAEYILLRGAGDLTAFPGDDVGGRNKLRRWLKMEEIDSYETVQAVTAKWKPFPGLVYFHLLLDDLNV